MPFFVRRCSLLLVVLAITCVCAAEARAQFQPDSIFFNLVERPTRNKNVFGTTFDANGFVSGWGSNYMLYELQLAIPNLGPSPYYFDFMYTQVVANRGNQNNDPTNALRFALFNEYPLDVESPISDEFALARTTINQAAVSPTFTPYLLGPSTGPGIPVNESSSNYWLVVYAGGSVANQGYGLKVDQVLKEVEFYDNTSEVVEMKYFGGEPPSFQTAGTFVPLPEPSSLALGCAGALVACGIAVRRRRT
ncbi:MAG: hypothetical protein ACKOEM_17025 [Planctomycetia bacterium]